MKLLSCYIENYGKIQTKKFDFENGLNIIKEDNGWGKTTLASFIKSMFYGLKDNRNRDVNGNDRIKYFPWQGGKFGGNIVFEIKLKKYKIERFFGKKPNEDEFFLYDYVSNKICKDFSSNIGEEIFGINSDGYERSTYIPQNDILFDEISDDIKTKLSNLINNTDDKHNFNEAINILEKTEKDIQPKNKRTTGKIENINNKLKFLQNNIDECETYEKESERLLNEINEKKTKIIDYKEKLSEINKKIQYQNTINEQKANKNFYEQLNEQILKDKKELKSLEEFFNGQDVEKINIEVVERDIIDAKRQKAENETLINDLENQKNSLNLIIAKKSANIEKIEAINTKKSILESKREIFNTKEKQYKKNIDELNIQVLTTVLPKQPILKPFQTKKNNNIFNVILLAIGCLLLICGTILICYKNKFAFDVIILCVIILSLAVISFIFSSVLFLKNYIDKKTSTNYNKSAFLPFQEDVDISNRDIEIEKNQANILINQEELKENETLIVECVEQIKKINLEDVETEENIRSLIKEKEKKINTSMTAYNNLLEKIEIFLKEFNCNDDSLSLCLMEIKNNIKSYTEIAKRLTENVEKINSFMKNKDKDFLTAKIIDYGDIEDLVVNKKNYEKDFNELQVSINNLTKNQLDVEEKSNNKEALQNEKIGIEEEKENLLKELTTIQMTIQYLTQAKEIIASKYLDPIIDSCKVLLSKFDTNNFKILFDSDSKIFIEENGQNRKLDFYSAGYKELICICARIALINSIFKNEKPYVILDDPFVNFDDEKLEKMKDFVVLLSKNYQIIYFTCHNSRKII